MGWYDRSGLLYSMSTDTGDALNGILNLSYLIRLTDLNGNPDPLIYDVAKAYAKKVVINGKAYAGVASLKMASHDDVTGIICAIPAVGIVGKIESAPYFYRWGEFVLYNYWNGVKWSKFFLWILAGKLVFSCWRDYKAENGVYETDGKLLAWLILESFNLRLTKKICYTILKKKFGDQWLLHLMKIKYEPGHPLVAEAEKWKSS